MYQPVPFLTEANVSDSISKIRIRFYFGSLDLTEKRKRD